MLSILERCKGNAHDAVAFAVKSILFRASRYERNGKTYLTGAICEEFALDPAADMKEIVGWCKEAMDLIEPTWGKPGYNESKGCGNFSKGPVVVNGKMYSREEIERICACHESPGADGL